MSLIRDDVTKEIICPHGDTGTLMFRLTGADERPLPQPLDNCAALFAVCKPNGGRDAKGYTDKASMWTKVVLVADDDTGEEYDAAIFLFDHPFTCQIQPGEYHYDVRIIINPQYSEPGGELLWEDPAIEVHSVYAIEGKLPLYTVPGVAKNV